MNTKHKTLNTAALHHKLASQATDAHKKFTKKHPHAHSFFVTHGIDLKKLRAFAAKTISSGIFATTVMLASPFLQHNTNTHQEIAQLTQAQREKKLSDIVKKNLPSSIGDPLTKEQESEVQSGIGQVWNIDAWPTLHGERLNHVYGRMGAEQHLPRFPGDTIAQHDEFQRSGITPGRGAWGYFASSKHELTDDLIQKEKYYVAVQTLYLSDWNTRTAYLRDWYKYRKVIVVNPQNGKTILCDIADAGPAKWTGKHFGGSPEVMAYLKINTGKQNHPVILYFVNDPDNSLPLGPVTKPVESVHLANK